MLPLIGGIVAVLATFASMVIAILGVRAQSQARRDAKEAKDGELTVEGSDINLKWMQASLARADSERQQYRDEIIDLRKEMIAMAERASADHTACEERVRLLTVEVEKLKRGQRHE